MTRLHLGCGRTILEGWINLAVVRLPGVDVVANLDDCQNNPLPFEESCIDDAVEDPTHARQYFLNSFGYFLQPFYWRADYDPTDIEERRRGKSS